VANFIAEHLLSLTAPSVERRGVIPERPLPACHLVEAGVRTSQARVSV
jgi:hypothetical protein